MEDENKIMGECWAPPKPPCHPASMHDCKKTLATTRIAIMHLSGFYVWFCKFYFRPRSTSRCVWRRLLFSLNVLHRKKKHDKDDMKLLRRRCGFDTQATQPKGYDDDCARRGCDGRELPQLVCGGGGKKLCGCR